MIENQSNYFAKTKELIDNEWFDKNANLLILYKQTNFDEINKNEIIDIEENPYLFKKQVLIYTDSEKQKLVEAIQDSGLNYKQFLEKKALSNQVFEQHKTNINNNNFESLLYRICHKIPFINIKVSQENGLLALTDNNTIKVNSSDFKAINDVLSENVFNESISDIENLSQDEIYEQLTIVLNQDEN
ncbi:ABC-three component system middle component 1 [Flavobacterium sp. ZB4R12]|uniref:ABC-three component system middle component 1 n=1 Tax=Flavobacterium sp. ZB4R12 TaxID=3398732 RepID=UPI003AAE69AB